jgi:hypothetical protein
MCFYFHIACAIFKKNESSMFVLYYSPIIFLLFSFFFFLVDLIFSSSAMEHAWFNLSCIGDSAWSFSFIVLLFVPCDSFLQVLGL